MKMMHIKQLEQFENEFQLQIVKYHGIKLALLDRQFEVLSEMLECFWIDNRRLDFNDNPLEPIDNDLVCEYVAHLLLISGQRKIYASRRLLLCGYLDSVVANLRGVIESLYYSDISRQDIVQAKNWIRRRRIETSGTPRVHRRIGYYRYGRMWGFLCGGGSHPEYLSVNLSLAGFSTSMFSAARKDNLPHKHSLETANRVSLMLQENHDVIDGLLIFLNDIAEAFLVYLRDTYSNKYSQIKRLSSSLEIILGENLRIIKRDIEKYKIKRRIH